MKRIFLTMLLLFSSLPLQAAGLGGVYGQGRSQFSVGGGNGHAFNKSYFVIGASVSYYVMDGLGVGFSFEKWSGNDPGISKYAPFIQYVFLQSSSSVHPYIGAFYRHTAINGLPGINSVGERAGVNIAIQPNAYFSFGFVQESYLDCQLQIYGSCSETYPDLGLTFAF